jgi:hypothetical protein
MPSNKQRFEVFKRDLFRCQYCGRTPPEVVLEVDHINPKSKGGKGNLDNYITACFECNRGKGKNKVDAIPSALIDKVSVLKEKRAQLKHYNDMLASLQKERCKLIELVCSCFYTSYPGRSPSERFKQTTITGFLNKLPAEEVIEAMEIACSRNKDTGTETLQYFCGICWMKIRQHKEDLEDAQSDN